MQCKRLPEEEEGEIPNSAAQLSIKPVSLRTVSIFFLTTSLKLVLAIKAIESE
ncbi:hypothetical protein QG37_00977 [Candidozyma auris]|nr:hypothetical protein QG37_00977 [[Candida] auris]